MAGHSFKTAEGGVCYIDYPDAFGEAVVNGRVWRWDFHRYLGPCFLRKDGEPRKCQCPTNPAVWTAFGKWVDQFEAQYQEYQQANTR